MKKKSILLLVFVLGIGTGFFLKPQILPSHAIFQTSTIPALMQGIYDGHYSVAELRKHGDFGIGTFDRLDGEMVALEGRFFQAASDGTLKEAQGALTTPFATVVHFKPETHFFLSSAMTFSDLQKDLDRRFGIRNLFYAIKIEGLFTWIKVRSVPRQSPPYRKLTEIVETQPVFQRENIRGVLVGFRLPANIKSLNVPGYHFHFLSEDRSFGGHVLDGALAQGEGAVETLNRLLWDVPEAGPYTKADLFDAPANDLAKVEQ